MHNGWQGDGPLHADDPDRADRLRLGRRAARLRRAAGRAHRLDPHRRPGASTCARSSPGWRVVGSPTPGVARSTSRRPPAVVAPLRSDRVHAAFGYTGNESPVPNAGRTLSLRWCSTGATRRRLALVTPSAPGRLQPACRQWLGGNAIRAGLVAKEDAEEREPPPARYSGTWPRSPSGSASTSGADASPAARPRRYHRVLAARSAGIEKGPLCDPFWSSGGRDSNPRPSGYEIDDELIAASARVTSTRLRLPEVSSSCPQIDACLMPGSAHMSPECRFAWKAAAKADPSRSAR